MKRFVFTVLSLTLMSVPAAAQGQDTDWNRYTLNDLGGVFVRFEVSRACETAGVTATALEAEVSIKLIEAEVGVLTRAELLTHLAMPELRISLDCVAGSGASSDAVAYSVGIRVQQSAQMLRDTQITLPEAVTWYSTKLGISPAGETADAIGATVMEQVDAFAAVWATVHAEEGGSK